MSYYIDYKMRYPRWDRIIHMIAHVLFVLLVLLVTYVIEVCLVFLSSAQGDTSLAQLFADYGMGWLASAPMFILPGLAALVALVKPSAYKKLGATRISSAAFPTIGLFDNEKSARKSGGSPVKIDGTQARAHGSGR